MPESPPQKSRAFNFGAGGLLIGLLFPFLATMLALLSQGIPFTMVNVLSLHGSNDQLKIMDALPFVMGAFAFLLGRREDKSHEIQFGLEKAAEQRIREINETNFFQSKINSLLNLSLEELTLKDVLERALAIILDTPWFSANPTGGIFLVEDQPQTLVLKASQNMDSTLSTLCANVGFGRCLCGRTALIARSSLQIVSTNGMKTAMMIFSRTVITVCQSSKTNRSSACWWSLSKKDIDRSNARLSSWNPLPALSAGSSKESKPTNTCIYKQRFWKPPPMQLW